jgi:ABC-type glycerol-3-phosphate transport system substrate-binding protein
VRPPAGLRRRACLGGAGSLAAGLAGSALLAACGGEQPAAPGTQLSQQITLSYVAALPAANPEAAGWLDALQDWNPQNDKLKVRLDDAQGATDITKLKAMLAANTIPDVMMIGYRGDPADLYNLGATIDVDTELKTEKDWAKQRADIFPGYLETSLWAGKMVAIPGHGTCQAMIYSPEQLQNAGLTAPKDRWTWTDFLTIAKKVARPPDVWGLDLSWSYVFWAMWIGANGARPLSKDNRHLTLNTPQVQEATTFMLDLVRGGVAPPESSAELIGKGQTAFEHQGSYRIATLRQNGTNFGVIHMPIKAELFVSASGYSAVVPRNVPPERRHASALVAKWLNAPAQQAKLCARSLSQPVSKAATEHKIIRDLMASDPQAKGFLDLAQYAWRWPNLPSFGKLGPVLTTAIGDVLGQKIGVNDALARAERDGQPFLDDDARTAAEASAARQ